MPKLRTIDLFTIILTIVISVYFFIFGAGAWWFQIGLLVLSVLFLMYGSNWVVDGASEIGILLGLSKFFVGATIVSAGTTFPELFTNLRSAQVKNIDFAIGNVLGSYTFNTLGIIGAASLVSIIVYMFIKAKKQKGEISRLEVKRSVSLKIIFAIVSVVLLFVLCFIGNGLDRVDGMILLTCFIGWLVFLYFDMKKQQEEQDFEKSKEIHFKKRFAQLPRPIGVMLLGFVFLIIGSNFLVESASNLAKIANLSNTFIGLTIVAMGTSAPEFAVSVSSAFKKDYELGIGNIIGADVLDIFMVLGVSSTIKDIPFQTKNMVDILVSIGAMLLLGLSLWLIKPRYKLTWWKGLIFLSCYGVYILYLLERDGVINLLPKIIGS